MPAPVRPPETGAEVIVSLSPCCGASAKGGESGIICRNCYQPWDDYGHETYERVAVLSDMGGIDGLRAAGGGGVPHPSIVVAAWSG